MLIFFTRYLDLAIKKSWFLITSNFFLSWLSVGPLSSVRLSVTVNSSICLVVHPFCVCIHMFVCISVLFVHLSVFLPFHTLVCLPISLSVYPSVCLPICLFFCPHIRLSVYPSVCLAVHPSACLSIVSVHILIIFQRSFGTGMSMKKL